MGKIHNIRDLCGNAICTLPDPNARALSKKIEGGWGVSWGKRPRRVCSGEIVFGAFIFYFPVTYVSAHFYFGLRDKNGHKLARVMANQEMRAFCPQQSANIRGPDDFCSLLRFSEIVC